MNKLIYIALAVLFSISLSACQDDKTEPESNAMPASTSAEQTGTNAENRQDDMPSR